MRWRNSELHCASSVCAGRTSYRLQAGICFPATVEVARASTSYFKESGRYMEACPTVQSRPAEDGHRTWSGWTLHIAASNVQDMSEVLVRDITGCQSRPW